MTANRFANAKALALRLIQKNGEKATLQRRVNAAPADSSKPWYPGTTPTVTPTPVDAVFLGIKATRGAADDLVRRKETGRVLLVASQLTSDPDPTRDVIVRVDGSSWSITEVDSVNPNEDKIIYKLKVER